MPDSGSEVSGFETRLAAMDRRLRELQHELAPERDAGAVSDPGEVPPSERWRGAAPADGLGRHAPEPVRLHAAPEAPAARVPAPFPAPPEAPRPAAFPSALPATPPPQLDVLAELYSQLLASVRELLDGYELVLGQLAGSSDGAAAQVAPEPASSSPGGPAGPAEVAVSAGPFADTAALRDFEDALAQLPGVERVALRGYESGDRAIVEVRLR